MQNNIAPEKKKNKKLFRKLMLYLILASVLMAVFSSLLFAYFGRKNFSKQVVDDLIPRATTFSNIISEYFDGIITEESVNRFVFNNRNIGATVLVYDAQGNIYVPSRTHAFPGQPFEQQGDLSFDDIVSKVLGTGESVQQTRFDLALIAVPVVSKLNVTSGVVIVLKMSADLRSAMRSMMLALVTSFVIVTVFMVAFAYYGGKKISDPIQQMEEIAIAMQQGDFSKRADDSIENEIGRLGGALNALSRKLSITISDLEAARKRLNKILDALSEGVAAFEANELIYANPAVSELLQPATGTYSIETFKQIVPEFEKRYYKTLTEGRVDTVEFEHKERVIGCSFMKLDAENRDSDGIVLLMRDVTEAVRLEQTRRDYVANVSHELKTPITSIRSLAETLNDGMIRKEEEQNRYYGFILREANRMGHLIEELLELSRIQSGSVAFMKEDFSLNELMNGLIERMKLIAEYSGIVLNYRCDEEISVFSNRSRIDQVCVAIIDNAIKYCVDSGSISVAVNKTGKKAIVSIENDGHIDESDLPHLFERFYKADKSHRGNGTGLGLAITKEILERLGEEIKVYGGKDKVSFVFTIELTEDRSMSV